jgi:uncharacterized protein YyaL (SSP411 family)
MRTPDGRLLRTFNAGTAKLGAYLEDHAFLLEALLVLYEATFEERWFVEARALADTIVARFGDPERGGFFSTADDHEALIARRKDLEDAPIPSGASAAALGLLRLAALTGEHAYEEQAAGQLALLHEVAVRHPGAFGHLLQALDLYLAPRREVALAATPRGRALSAAGEARRPTWSSRPPRRRRHRSRAHARAHLGRRSRGRLRVSARRRPVTEPDELRAMLASQRRDRPTAVTVGAGRHRARDPYTPC